MQNSVTINPEVSTTAYSSLKTKINIKWSTVIYVLAGAGIFFRIFHFLYNRSLWLDEMYLSSSIVKMNFLELTGPLDYQQKAPIGYLWLTKVGVMMFGNGEMALRLFPLICGIASIFVFISVTKHFLKPLGIAVATGIMALSPHLIYHAVEAKQYSTELLTTVLALYLYTRFDKKNDVKSLLLWGFWGALILWFSFSSIFIFAGLAASISLYHLLRKDWKLLFLSFIPFLIWILSFGVNYFLFTSKYGSDSAWLTSWFMNRGGFMPSNLFGIAKWLGKRIISLFDFPLGLSWFSMNGILYDTRLLFMIGLTAVVPLILFFLGLFFSFKKMLKTFFILVFPLLLHLTATFLLIYPFFERLLVYLAPLLILIIAIGAENVLSFLKRKEILNQSFKEYKSSSTNDDKAFQTLERQDASLELKNSNATYINKLGLLILVLLLASPLINSVKATIIPENFGGYKHWHQRELFEYVNKNFKKGDKVYIYWYTEVPYKYYSSVNKYNFGAVLGKDYRFSCTELNEYLKKVRADIESLWLDGERLWLVYPNLLDSRIGDMDKNPQWYYQDLNHHLKVKETEFKSIGTPIDSFKTKERINLYLFEKAKP